MMSMASGRLVRTCSTLCENKSDIYLSARKSYKKNQDDLVCTASLLHI